MSWEVESMSRALITGVSGALGSALVEELAAEGLVADGVSRSQAAPPGVRLVGVGDLGALDWEGLVRGRDLVFHLAAHVHRHAPAAREAGEFHRVNAEATAALARACRAHGALLVFASTVAVLGRGDGADDGTSGAPVTDYGRSKWQAEESVRTEGKRGLRFAILRFPLLYGPLGRGNMERMLSAIRRGCYWPIGDQGVRKSCLSYADAARALTLAARTAAAHGRAWVVAPPIAPTIGEIHAAAYLAAGKRPPRWALPRWAALLTGHAADGALRLTGRPAGTARAISILTAPAWFDGARFMRATGFSPAVSLKDGIRSTMEWLSEDSASDGPSPRRSA